MLVYNNQSSLLTIFGFSCPRRRTHYIKFYIMFNCSSIFTSNLKILIHDVRWIMTTSHPLLKSHYDVLGVHKNCSQAQIKEAYFKLSKLYHPDKNESVEAVEKFRDINAAYEILKNTKLRKLYDRDETMSYETARDSETKQSHTYRTFYSSRTKRQTASHYDYDEWENAHYGEQFRRRQGAKVRWEDIVQRKEEMIRRKKEFNKIMYVLCSGFGLYMIIAWLDLTGYDKPRPIKKDKNGND